MLITPDLVNFQEAALGLIPLSDEQKGEVQYTKFESTNPDVTDTVHGDLWTEEVTAHDGILFNEDHGCILRFHGTPRGEEVAITREGDVLTGATADDREQNTGQNLPRFRAYDFRMAYIVKTDGPERRASLLDSMDKQRADSEDRLITTIAKAFEKVGASNASSSPPDIKGLLDDLNEDQRRALIEGGGDDISAPPEDDEDVELVGAGNVKRVVSKKK